MSALPSLSQQEIERYSRQLILKEWSTARQLRLKDFQIAVTSELPLAVIYLAALGIGRIVVFGEEANAKKLIRQVSGLNSDIKSDWLALPPPACGATIAMAGTAIGEPRHGLVCSVDTAKLVIELIQRQETRTHSTSYTYPRPTFLDPTNLLGTIAAAILTDQVIKNP